MCRSAPWESPWLAPGPDRLALLDERARPLGEVLGGHHGRRLLVGNPPGLVVGGEHAAEDDVATRLDRPWRVRADAGGERERAVERRARLAQLVDQADRVGTLGVD